MIRPPLAKLAFTGALSATIWGSFLVDEAAACGGFFCSQQQPVNQAAERIVFAQNDDDTVTAVIQIMYEGPSESFSWLLPISTVPEADEIAVSSDIAFQRLQNFTNPRYTLTTRVEGTCRSDFASADGGFVGVTGGVAATSGGAPVNGGGDGVMVEASGVVGSFEWTVISFDPELDDPADAAVVWLEDNDYDVTPEGAELIGPYLADGMYLLALKLVKGADTGSIRPIVLTYDAGEPMIPIKLTAVAANDDMGVMTWLLGNDRAIPNNYLALELNEAQINWFNASSNYNDVVIAAAKEAGGQGFVTEFAGSSSSLAAVVWTEYDEAVWQDIQSRVYSSFAQIFQATYYTYGSFDGYWDAVKRTVTLPEGVSFEDFQLCPSCYTDVMLSPSEYFAALEEDVIEPVRLMQDLIDSSRYTTRLYTTMSAADMTLDPAFSFNGDLGDVSNQHTAERIIECSEDVYEWEAPWRIELPQGGVIRGSAASASAQSWPLALQEQPATFRMMQLSASGKGQLIQDNSEAIEEQLDDYNASLDLPGGTSGGTASAGSADGTGGTSGSATRGGPMAGDDAPSRAGGGGGCAVVSGAAPLPQSLALSLFGLALLAIRRKR